MRHFTTHCMTLHQAPSDLVQTRCPHFPQNALGIASVVSRSTHAGFRRPFPSLIQPYLDMQAATKSGRDQALPLADVLESCRRCQVATSRIKVTLVEWNRFTTVQISICPCSPAPCQLLKRGYFACAPCRPTLAVNCSLLDLVLILFANTAPNLTAWAQTLEMFWRQMGYFLGPKDSLRRRFASALQWYQLLQDSARKHIDSLICRPTAVLNDRKRSHNANEASESADTADWAGDDYGKRMRLNSSTMDHGDDCDDSSAVDPDYSPSSSQASNLSTHGSAALGSGDEDVVRGTRPQTPFSERQDEPPARPSDYLRHACPLCFGGRRPQLDRSAVHSTVCLDANFQQKRRTNSGQYDPRLEHADTRFVSAADVELMEVFVAAQRMSIPLNPRKSSMLGPTVDDSILDECEQSFIAAQEKVAKASKNYYSDTGLMALLCRHDRVLWLVSLTSPGERQHYALALLARLFSHLPSWWIIGLLYDIACQLCRSIHKHDLLPGFSHRLVFAVSVFHAYGHQWPCQLVYHPRKRDGFGLTDGEGCERFWSAIRRLIPGLRISGFFRRLLVLDFQVEFLANESMWSLGTWLYRRFTSCHAKQIEAQYKLDVCGVDRKTLQAEWAAQVKAQTQPPPRQSRNAADKIIAEILLKLSDISDLKRDVRDIQKRMKKLNIHDDRAFDQLVDDVEKAEREIRALAKRIKTLEASLGLPAQRKLVELKSNAFLRSRVNARALKSRIRSRLVEHKFERSKLERTYRHQVMQEKEHAQTKDLVHRKQRGISALVIKFNKLVDRMAELKTDGKAPLGACIPRKLDGQKLFRLDVDDEVWIEDPGLGNQDEALVPRWLGDENVRQGIVAMLEVRRCEEETERLQLEADALRSWLAEEVSLTEAAIRTCAARLGASSVVYQLQCRLDRLYDLGSAWQSDMGYLSHGRSALLDMTARPRRAIPVVCAARDVAAALDNSELALVSSDDGVGSLAEGQTDEDEPAADVMDSLDLASESDSARAWPLTRVNAEDEHMSDSSADSFDEPGRTCGRYMCAGEDVARFADPSGWLSGQGIAICAEAFLSTLGDPQARRVDHLPSLLFSEVDSYLKSVNAAEADKSARIREGIESIISKAIPPARAEMWLIPVHVPGHWILVEMSWTTRGMRVYDSIPEGPGHNGYTANSKVLAYALLEMLRSWFSYPCDASWTWLWEQRERRQFNTFDCGAFVLADLVSLATVGIPSGKTGREMGAWRAELLLALRRMDVRVRGKWTKPRLETFIDLSD